MIGLRKRNSSAIGLLKKSSVSISSSIVGMWKQQQSSRMLYEGLTLAGGAARYLRPLLEAKGGQKSISMASLAGRSLVPGARQLVQLVSCITWLAAKGPEYIHRESTKLLRWATKAIALSSMPAACRSSSFQSIVRGMLPWLMAWK